MLDAVKNVIFVTLTLPNFNNKKSVTECMKIRKKKIKKG